jgi:hypothetical protein
MAVSTAISSRVGFDTRKRRIGFPAEIGPCEPVYSTVPETTSGVSPAIAPGGNRNETVDNSMVAASAWLHS